MHQQLRNMKILTLLGERRGDKVAEVTSMSHSLIYWQNFKLIFLAAQSLSSTKILSVFPFTLQ